MAKNNGICKSVCAWAVVCMGSCDVLALYFRLKEDEQIMNIEEQILSNFVVYSIFLACRGNSILHYLTFHFIVVEPA